MTSQWVMTIGKDVHCDVTMSNGITICTYHAITMHTDVAMIFFYWVLLRQI